MLRERTTWKTKINTERILKNHILNWINLPHWLAFVIMMMNL
jgi:hypothetical protein